MSKWNSEQYLKFKKQRTQPAIDLAKRISVEHPNNILDIGCGPGNSTSVLKKIFPQACILGVDSSEDMIKKAKELYPDINFKLCDVTTELDKLDKYDVIFSNACLQWIPNHKEFIPMLFNSLNENGVLAVQIPMNGRETLFKIMNEVISEPQWDFSSMSIETNETLLPEEYFDILSSCTENFDIWETVYYHNMPSVEAMVEWVKGTRLRPYLNALDKTKAENLEKEITKRAAMLYNTQENGEIIFKFRRFFFVAIKLN
ncbi:MAG: methyltransferase domain-containing protein [Clostridia bacterium]|nr:methyltransferase domain-containing protein [Clostridia bacterium]